MVMSVAVVLTGAAFLLACGSDDDASDDAAHRRHER
jgi:hypothetical protein